MKNKPLKKLLNQREWIPVAVVLLLGCFLRLIWLGNLPYGFNQDEASAAYDAWSLLNYGVDRCGNSWPVLLEAWGSGQNVLYSYLSMPFIALLGLNVFSFRLVSAISGCLCLVVFWLMARRCRGKGFGLSALFILAVNPWHIMISRWGLESNLLPFCLFAGIYFTSLSKDKPWALIFAALFLGLSLYAYGTAFFFLPVFLVLVCIWLRRDLKNKWAFAALGLFIVIAVPISLCQLINTLNGNEITVLGITLPRLNEARQASTSVFGGGGIKSMNDNFLKFMDIVLHQTDGLTHNSIKSGGIYYFFGVPLAALGLIISLGSRKRCRYETPVRFAFFASLITAFLITPNINRMNMIWLPIIYFSAIGFHYILCKLEKWGGILVIGVLVCTYLFSLNYVNSFKTSPYDGYYPGLVEAIEYVEAHNPESVYITDYVNQPYVFVLFATKTAPYDFYSDVKYINPDGALRHVSSFGKYSFGPAQSANGEYKILHYTEAIGMEIASFGNYLVCK